MIKSYTPILKLLTFAVLVLGFSLFYSHQNLLSACTWTGNNDNTWSDPGNWTDCGGNAPTSGSDLIFPDGASNMNTDNDIDPGDYTNFQNITIANDSYTFIGNDIDLFGILQFDGVSQTLSFDLGINSFQAYLALKVSDADSVMDITGNINSGTDLYKQSPGTVILEGASTGNFIFHIEQGILNVTNPSALSDFTSIQISNGAELQLDGDIVTSSPIVLAGTINVVSGNSTLSGNINITDVSTFIGNGTTLNLSGVISGTNDLTKDGTFTMYLSGSSGNTFTGGTNLINGDLFLQKSSGLAIPSTTINIGDTNGAVDSARLLVQASDQFNSSASIVIQSDGFLAYEGVGTTNNINNLDVTLGHVKLTGTSVISGDFSLRGGHLETYDTVAISSDSMTCSNYSTVMSIVDGDGITFSNTDFSIIGEYTDGDIQCTFNTHIHGGANIVIQGRIMRFIGNNDFTGLVVINSNSILEIGNANALGASSSGTTVALGGALSLFNNITVTSEPLTIMGGSVDSRGALGASSETNVYGGPITLSGANDIYITVLTDANLTLTGGISGSTSNRIVFQRYGQGAGVIQLGAANSFTASSIAMYDVEVRKNASVNIFPDTLELFLNQYTIFDLNSFAETIGSLTGDSGSKVKLGNATFSVGASNANSTFAGVIEGNGGVTKLGTGVTTLSGDNTYTGVTNIAAGKLVINGQQSGSNVSLNGSGSLGGSGRVGVITGGGSGAISPGNSPGILNVTGNVAFANTNSFNVDINGTTVGTEYDRLNVTGSVNLNGATLNITLGNGFTPVSGQNFTIVQASGVLIGTFNGMPNGSTFSVGGNTFTINYGSNSVVVTVATGGVQGNGGNNNGGNLLSETGISIPLVALSVLVFTTVVVFFSNSYINKRKRLNKNFR